MRMGPWLVIRGLVFGNLILILLTSALAANASTTSPLAQSNAQPANAPEAQTTSAGATAAQEEQKTMDQSLAKSPLVPGACEVSPAFPDTVRQWCDVITSMAE